MARIALDEVNGMAPGEAREPSSAALRRARAREALEELADAAQHVLRRDPGCHPPLAPALARATVHVAAYCEHVDRAVVPSVAQVGRFGALLSDHVQRFVTRQQSELRRLGEQLEHTPRSAGVAHGIVMTVMLLLADLDAHSHEIELIGQAETELRQVA